MTAKKNAWEGWRSGNEAMARTAFANHEVDLSSLVSNLTRRQIMQRAAGAGLLLAFPWADRILAATPVIPKVNFTRNKTGDGIMGPFGEARIYNVGGQVLPTVVTALGSRAVMDLTSRSPFVRFGSPTNRAAITLTASGVQYGSAKAVPWSNAVARDIIKNIIADPDKARGALLLRSALQTSYPVASMLLQPKLTVGRQMATVMANGAAGFAANSMNCTVTTVTDTVITTITQMVAVVLTATQQYQQCYDAEVAKLPCSAAGVGAGLCAAGICGLKSFVDIVTGWATIATTVVNEVARQVVVCTAPSMNRWPNPWDFPIAISGGVVPSKKQVFNINDAIAFLKSVCNFFGPFAKCLLDGKWSLAELNTPLNLGGSNTVIPYGVKVCLSSACATQLSPAGIGAELAANWLLLLGALAALSPSFAAMAAGFGIVATPAIAAAAAANPVLAAIAGIILAFILLAMWYATIICAQLAYQICCTNNLADGLVCIEHPTFAIALVSIALFGVGGLNSVLIPPIVTG